MTTPHEPTTPPPPPLALGTPTKPKTWMNIVALATGLLAVPIVPVVFGHLGVSAAKYGLADHRRLGLIGLILGYVWIVVWGAFIAFLGAAATFCANNPDAASCASVTG